MAVPFFACLWGALALLAQTAWAASTTDGLFHGCNFESYERVWNNGAKDVYTCLNFDFDAVEITVVSNPTFSSATVYLTAGADCVKKPTDKSFKFYKSFTVADGGIAAVVVDDAKSITLSNSLGSFCIIQVCTNFFFSCRTWLSMKSTKKQGMFV